MYGQAVADGVKANRLDSRLFGLLGSASAYCELGDLEHAAQALAEARAAMKGTVPPGSPPALAAEVVAGRIALARGQLDEAERLFTATLAAFEARKQSNGSAVMLYLHRSEVARRQQRTDDALRDAQSALAMARKAAGRHSLLEPDRAGASRRGRCIAARLAAARRRAPPSRRRSTIFGMRSATSIRRRVSRWRRRPAACGNEPRRVAGPPRRRGRRRIGAAPLRFPS